jgi:mono/diheme cytochrome c family protein
VPKGSIAKGAELMAGGNGKTINCTYCHGANLKGLGEVPSIAGGRPNTFSVSSTT